MKDDFRSFLAPEAACRGAGQGREPVGKCWICDKLLYRDEHKKWVFFTNILVCRNHPGVGAWYKGAIRMGEEKLKISMGE